MRNFLVALAVLLGACSDVPVEHQVDSTFIMTDTTVQYRQSKIQDGTLAAPMPAVTPAEGEHLSAFIPRGYSLLDTARGDMNLDAYDDMLLVLEDAETGIRPLIVLLGDTNGLRLVARNDSVILTAYMGGMCCDPYQDVSIDHGSFTVEHYGGMNTMRWERTMLFTYKQSMHDWILKSDSSILYATADTSREEHQVTNQAQFGRAHFSDYVSW